MPGATPTLLRMPAQIRGDAGREPPGRRAAMPGMIDVVVIPAGGSVVPNPPAWQ